MKQGWEEIQLGELCEFRNGLWKGKKPPFVTSKVIRMTNFTKECEMNTIDPIELEVEEKQFSSRNLIDGDLLLEKSGGGPKQPVGRVVRFKAPDNGNYSFSNFTTRIRISKLDKIDSKYLHKYLKFFYLMGKTESLQSNSTNIRNIKMPAFKAILIPIPPLEEQKQIVAKLDQCFEAIDKAKANAAKNLENAKELFQSKLNDIFSQKGEGWVEKRLGEIGKPSMCKRIFKDETLADGEIPFYKIGTFGKEPNAFISKALYREYREKYRFPKKGDVLISASGTIGRTVIYDGEPAYFQDSNIVWIDNNESSVTNMFLFTLYKSVKWGESKGTTIKRLYNSNLENIEIHYPESFEEQKQIVDQLNTLQKQTQSLESKYQQELNSLEELKKSILQKAFEGEL